jgi:tungstate transport system permease protein
MGIGVVPGFVLGYVDFPGKRAARTFVDSMLSFPTVVIGLIVYAFVSRRGPLGDLELLYSVPGMAIGLTILGCPSSPP